MGRVICVGDRSQAIYRFRGADSQAMDRMQERFNCRPLPLSISYRCPKAVVRQAQRWVVGIESAPEAAEGLVVEFPVHEYADCGVCICGARRDNVTIGLDPRRCDRPARWLLKDFRSTDVLLCRLTRPLVETAFKLIRARIACRVLGRDIGQGLVALVRKSKLDEGRAVGEFSQWLDKYEQRESQKLRDKEEWAKLGLLGDKLSTVRVFVDDCETTDTIHRLIQEIEQLFKDDGANGKITLSTIHKFKGQEAKRIFILDADKFMPCSWSNDPQGEQNLMYVAATRAQEELYYLRTEQMGE